MAVLNILQKTTKRNLVNDKGDLIAKKFSNQIIYFGKVQDQKVVYNTLKVPYGKSLNLPFLTERL